MAQTGFVFSFFLAVLGCFPTPLFAAVALEQDEILVMDGGKEIRKVGVFAQETALRDDLSKKIYKALGVKSQAELERKGLQDAFALEWKERLRVNLMDPPQLRFTDKKGQTLHLLPLPTAEKPEIKLFKRDKNGKPGFLRQANHKRAALSKNGQSAVVTRVAAETWVSTPSAVVGGNPLVTSVVEFYDAQGRMVWERTFDRNTEVTRETLSPNGRYLYLHLSREGRESSMFVDTQTQKSWRPDKPLDISSLDDQGKAWSAQVSTTTAVAPVNIKAFLEKSR